LGDLYDERKEDTQTQISAHAVGSDDYYARDLAYVRLEMQHGNTRLLSKNTQVGKLYACSDHSIPGSTRSFGRRVMACNEADKRRRLAARPFCRRFIASLAGLLPIPYFSGLLSFIVLLILISKFTSAEVWPDAALIVVVAWGLAALANIAIMMALRQ